MSPFSKNTPPNGGRGSSVRPLRGQMVCMGPTGGPKTQKKKENGIFEIRASRGGGQKSGRLPPLLMKKIAKYLC